MRTADSQLGLVTHGQLEGTPLSRQAISKRVASGALEVVHPGLYRVRGSGTSEDQSRLAALLATGPESWLSHRSAGEFWSLEGVRADLPEVVVAHNRRLDVDDVIVHRTRRLPDVDCTLRGKWRLTSVARTLVDLAGALTRRELEVALDDALRRRIVTIDQILTALDARGPNGVRGWGRLNRMVHVRRGTAPTGSSKETIFFSGLRRRGLPIPVKQYRVFDGSGRMIARPDFAYPDIKLAIEVDGGHHMDPTQWEEDLARQNRLILAGWRFLRFPRVDRKGQRRAFETIEQAFAAFGEPSPTSGRQRLPKRGRNEG